MKSSHFGTIAATALAGFLTGGMAMGEGQYKGKGKDSVKKDTQKAAGVCKSNSCAGHVPGGRNECAGQVVEGVTTKEACEKDGKGSWTASTSK